MVAVVSCSKCDTALPAEAAAADSVHCPGCRRWLKVVAFPALVSEKKRGSFGERVLVEGESTCFYHSEKKAAVVCDGCGRFLCALCDIEMDDEHLCPGCLEAGRGTIGAKIDSECVLYEDLVIGLALVSFLLGPFGIISAIAAIFLGIRHWKKPQKVGAVWKVKKTLAVVVALGALALWGTMLFLAFFG